MKARNEVKKISEFERLVQAILDDAEIDITPKTRLEAYLKNCVEKCGCEGLPEPKSRADALLYALAEKMAEGGGDLPVNEFKAHKKMTNFRFDTAEMPGEFIADFSQSTILSFESAFGSSHTNASLKKLVLIGSTSSANTFTNAFQRRSGLTEIDGVLDFSLCGRQIDINAFSGATALEKVTFAPNSIKVTFNISTLEKLKDDALISIANGLNATADNQTLTFSNDLYLKSQSIYGNVVDGLFVKIDVPAGSQPPQGAITLYNFIHDDDYKGWNFGG